MLVKIIDTENREYHPYYNEIHRDKFLSDKFLSHTNT